MLVSAVCNALAIPRSRSGLVKAPEDPSALAWRAPRESVDYCPMGITIH